MSEWKSVTLADVADVIAGYAFKGEHFGDKGEKIIKIKDITPPSVDVHGAQRVDFTHYSKSKLEKYKLAKRDYVVAMTGATIGKIGKILSDDEAYINQRVAKIQAKESCDRDFIYYNLIGSDFEVFIQNNIDSHSAQENISASSIGRYPIQLPDLEEQKSIASVLSSLDDKIDLLHRQNKTLEAMAETLFRQWFVEGVGDWDMVPLEELFDFMEGPGIRNWQYTETGTPFINIRLISGGDIDISKASFVSNEEANGKYSHFHLQEGDMIVSTSGTLGKNAIVRKYGNPPIFHRSQK